VKAVVLLSGGMDSATCMGIAKEQGYELAALSIAYGQRHVIERESAEEVALYYGADLTLLDLPRRLFHGGGSALIAQDAVEMPDASYEELMASSGPSPTVVPFRNANLISAATSFAIGAQAEAVFFGAHAEDAHNWAYPDCTPEFIGAMAAAVLIGSYQAVRLVAPLQFMTKADVCAVGLRLGVPYAATHSCYRGERPACGTCPTCIERLHAFAANGVTDPIPYAGPRATVPLDAP
jgi:7-cyano-7-deazaguanine synthase